MKKKASFFEKISSGKGFYITATVCVCVIMAAIAVIYNSSMNMLEDVLPQETTAKVQKNQTGISDPRTSEKTTVGKTESTTQKKESTAERVTNEPSRVVTTAKATEPTFKKSSSFVAPSSGEIIKGFSVSPIFDETMGDWRSHPGTDYAVSENGEVKAIGNGRVSKVLSDPNWGYVIEIDCGEFTARYCGLLQGTTVKINSLVSQGDTIGKVGTIPCESAEDSHIHLEIIKDDDRIDPKTVIGK